MKRYLVALATVMILGAGTMTAAQAVEVDVGPGGVRVHPRHHFYRSYDAYRGCRVIIDRHINRFGERVTVRRRVCD